MLGLFYGFKEDCFNLTYLVILFTEFYIFRFFTKRYFYYFCSSISEIKIKEKKYV